MDGSDLEKVLAEPRTTSQGLAALLQRIGEREDEAKRLDGQLKDLKGETDLLKEEALEIMGTDGIRSLKSLDGRTWFSAHLRTLSIPEANREEVSRLAEARGWSITSVNSVKLRSLLNGELEAKELEAAGRGEPLIGADGDPITMTGGTEFEGLVQEGVIVQLRSRKS
jgi:hypothetical protein